MKLRRPRMDIENKILIPFVCISLAIVVCFCAILYFTEYRMKVAGEGQNAQTLLGYIQSDLELEDYRKNPEKLLEKYRSHYSGDSLFIYDGDGNLLLGQSAAAAEEMEVLAQITDPQLGWQISYRMDRGAVQAQFIEEQKYMILAAVAMLVVIVQASVLIAHNISDPIRRLSEICQNVSGNPGQEDPEEVEEYLGKSDEVGQLARAFARMMENIRTYTGELIRVKTLNESIVENLPFGVVAYDQGGQPFCVNASAAAMLGRQEERDEQGRTLEMLLEEIMSREDVLPDPARLTAPTGKIRDYEFGVWQLREPDGARWGVLCTIDDVTYKKRMEERSSEEEKLAYTGKLAADVAHEIRNPLAGIRAGIQVVSRKVTQERDQKLCEGMVREVDRVNLLIENLLNLSRRRESQKTTVSLNALFDELQLLYFKVAENKGIAFHAQVEGSLWLYADEGELRQVLINLINNAVKAMPDGGSLEIRGEKGADGVRLTVADTGVGMEPEKLEQVLHGPGTGGLGLSIVRRLLGANGGQLTMESRPGQGTRVQITFPGKGGEA